MYTYSTYICIYRVLYYTRSIDTCNIHWHQTGGNAHPFCLVFNSGDTHPHPAMIFVASMPYPVSYLRGADLLGRSISINVLASS